MAGIGVSPIVFLSLLLLAIGGANANFLGLATTRAVTVTGRICCTQNGNCPGTPVVGAVVSLTCSGAIFTPGVAANTTTTAGGTFTFTFTITTNFILAFYNIVPCIVTVQLPISAAATCPVLSNTGGRLIGAIVPTGAQTGTVRSFLRLPV